MNDPHDSADHPHVVILPSLLYGLALAAGFGLQWLFPRHIAATAARSWIGGALVAAGMALAWWGRRAMERAGTNVNPTEPATALVEAGPFRYTRNPLYVALTVVYVGLALLANALWVLLLIVPVVLVMHVGVIQREERYLDAKFPTYRDYRARVRRYL